MFAVPMIVIFPIYGLLRRGQPHPERRHANVLRATCWPTTRCYVDIPAARRVSMPTSAIISQKGGAAKTTLALHPAAVAQGAGAISLVIDTDPQAPASQWVVWRCDRPLVVVDSPSPRLAARVKAAKAQGTDLIVIDTPPYPDGAAHPAVEVADVVLIPCRSSAFDLSPIQTTAKLVQLLCQPAFVVFTAVSLNAPRAYEEAGKLVKCYGTLACPFILPDRAAYRHLSAQEATVTKTEPAGKGGDEVRELYTWTCRQLSLYVPSFKKVRAEPEAELRQPEHRAGAGRSAGLPTCADVNRRERERSRGEHRHRLQRRVHEADRRLLRSRNVLRHAYASSSPRQEPSGGDGGGVQRRTLEVRRKPDRGVRGHLWQRDRG